MDWRSAAGACGLSLCILLGLGGCNDNGEFKQTPRSLVSMATASGGHQLLDGAWIGCVSNNPSPDSGIVWVIIGVSILVRQESFTSTDNTCQGTESIQWEAIFITSNAQDQTLAGWSDGSTAPLPSGPPRADFSTSSATLADPPLATVFDVEVLRLDGNTDPAKGPVDKSKFQMARLIDDTASVQLMYGEIATPSSACDPATPGAVPGCLYSLPYLLTRQQ